MELIKHTPMGNVAIEGHVLVVWWGGGIAKGDGGGCSAPGKRSNVYYFK